MIIVGIVGFSCGGKTTLSKNLREQLGDKCLLISMDDYFKDPTEEQLKQLYDEEAPVNFDVPECVHLDTMQRDIEDIKAGKPVTLFFHDLYTWKPSNSLLVEPGKYEYIIVEGVFLMAHPSLAALFDATIWVETSEYVCALRRFYRYTQLIKGFSPSFVINDCVRNVIPGQEKFIKPFKSKCDIIYNGENSDPNCVDMVAHFIRKSLVAIQEKTISQLNSSTA